MFMLSPLGGFQPSGLILGSVFQITTAYSTVTGWNTDPAYPGSAISGNGVVSKGGKSGALLAASCLVANGYPLGSYSCTLQLFVNGISVVTGSPVSIAASGSGTVTVSTTANISGGDVLTLQAIASSGAGTNLKMQPTSSWLRIT
ncbi:hypothetical protein [Nocardia nova]|uniref:hypothetical protein n=1 Tax=Nocardia nova TaxID=37330 RepID=UPI001894A3A9|nr:hypothetical protein [Nocardia nova]MBF6277069.1 hypothetical protein [Nocardia nova]